MASIEEPGQEPPPIPPMPTYIQQQQQRGGGKTINVVEVKEEEGDSDTLTGHKQLVFRRSSLGNQNIIDK